MQNFIMNVTKIGYAGFAYDLFIFLGFLTVFFFYLYRGKYFNISATKSVLLVVTVYPAIYLWIHIQCWIESGFGVFGGHNIVRGFVYMPLIAIPAAKMLKIEWKKACDLLAPAPCVVHSISHLGCIFSGCCCGYPANWGIYNPSSQRVCFPSQPLEAITAMIIILILLVREKKNAYRVDGLSMPIMLMMFGFTRFLWEFLRDNEKIWLGCSSLAFHALFMGIVGIFMYVIIKKNNNKTFEK